MKPLAILSFFVAFLPLTPYVSAVKLIRSDSLMPCQDNSNFTTSLFNILLTPDNNTLHVQVIGVSSITGYVTADARVFAYGHQILRETLNPCTVKGFDLESLCPMQAGPINYDFNLPNLSKDALDNVPSELATVAPLSSDYTSLLYLTLKYSCCIRSTRYRS